MTEAGRGNRGWIFRGKDGLRTGWSIAIFLAVMLPLILIVYFAGLRFLHVGAVPSGEVTPRFLIVTQLETLVPVLAATAVMGRIEGRGLWSYGLGGGRKGAYFGAGYVGGTICLSILVAFLAVSGHLAFEGLSTHGGAVVVYAALWFLGFALVGIQEEALSRGYFLFTLARGIGFWPAAAVSSLIFAAAHMANPGETALGIAGTFAAGLIFCVLLRISGSLWLGIGCHASWDWAQSYLYGTPDSGWMAKGHLLATHPAGSTLISGGTAGPEGSVLAEPTLVIGLLVVAWVCKRAGLFAQG